jgi:excisionase family DNA binding protein
MVGNPIGKAVPPGYMTMAQFADRMGVSRATVRKWVRTGRLSPAKRQRFGELDVALFDADSVRQMQGAAR